MKRIEQERATQPLKVPTDIQQGKAGTHIQDAKASPDAEEEAVRLRAYQIYEERGMGEGSEMEDWLQAEAELRNSRQPSKAA